MLMKGYFKWEERAMEEAEIYSVWDKLDQYERQENEQQPARVYVYFDNNGYFVSSRFHSGNTLITIYENGKNVGNG